MLARLPVMQPTIGPPETTLETSCDSTEPEAKHTKRSEEHNPFAVFQEIRDTLDAHRQRETKWTTDAELALLVELWGRMARREARAFEFVFKKRVKGQMVEVTFTAKSVIRKLAQLKKVLKEEHYAFPAHTPPDEVAVMFPMYQQLLDAGSRQEIARSDEYGTFTWARRFRLQWSKAIVVCRVSEITSQVTKLDSPSYTRQVGVSTDPERLPSKK